MLRWLIQRGVVAIPKSVRAERMAENIDVFDFALTDDQMAPIATLDTGGSLFFDHRDPADRRPARQAAPGQLTDRGAWASSTTRTGFHHWP